jgi:hypothetical protein
MKYFFVSVTLTYDGYEWGCSDLIAANNKEEARKKAEETDYTHDNDSEVQQVEGVDEIPFAHYQILQQYI